MAKKQIGDNLEKARQQFRQFIDKNLSGDMQALRELNARIGECERRIQEHQAIKINLEERLGSIDREIVAGDFKSDLVEEVGQQSLKLQAVKQILDKLYKELDGFNRLRNASSAKLAVQLSKAFESIKRPFMEVVEAEENRLIGLLEETESVLRGCMDLGSYMDEFKGITGVTIGAYSSSYMICQPRKLVKFLRDRASRY